MSQQPDHRPPRAAAGADGAGADGAGAEGDREDEAREVLTGRIVVPGDRPEGPDAGTGSTGTGDAGTGDGDGPGRRTASMFAGDMADAAAGRARQVSELLSGTARLLGGVMAASAVAGAVAAVFVTVLLDAAFGWSTTAVVIVFVVLALPAIEVAVHRALLLSAYGDAAKLRRRFTDLPDATVGRVQEFTGKLQGLRHGGSGSGRRWFGAARSAGALRGIAGAAPELAGVLLLPLTRTLLLVTAGAAVVCWALLLVTPVVAVVALIGALAG